MSSVVGMGVAALLVSAIAEAQAPSASTPAQEEAHRLYDEGAAASKAGQTEKALDLYAKAWRLHRQWRIAASLGRVEHLLGKYRDAAEHLDFAMREAPEDKREATRQKAQPLLDEARAKVGTLRVTVSAPGAEVLIDGKVIGKAPLPAVVFVEPGPVLVEARLDGYVTVTERRTAGAGVEENVDLRLPRQVTVAVMPAPRGSPSVSQRGSNKIILIAGGAATVVGTILGAAFAAASNAKASQAFETRQPGPCPGGYCKDQFEALDRDRVTYAGVSMWSFIGAGAALAGTGIYALVTLPSKPKPDLKVGFVIGPDRVGTRFTVPW